jgi:hypothetical protein
MRLVATTFGGAALALLAVASSAMAQSYYDDQACRQYADEQTAALRAQVNSQAVGSTLLGAGLGAALGGAVGGGRGAGIGAASGAVFGGVGGVANAQNAAGYVQQYNADYAQCMAARSAPPLAYGAPSPYGAPAPSYPPAPGYAPQSSYPPPASSTGATANDLNRQELNSLATPLPAPYQPR